MARDRGKHSRRLGAGGWYGQLGWQRRGRDRFGQHKIYPADHPGPERDPQQRKKIFQTMFEKLGPDGRKKLRIHEQADHPYYDYAPECFAKGP